MTRLEIERAFRERAIERIDRWAMLGFAYPPNRSGVAARWRRHVIGMTPAVDEEARIAVDRCLVRQ